MTEARNSANTYRPLRVFLCHSSGAKAAVRDLNRRLKADGFAPWLDEEQLLPGQNWQEEIPEAMRACDAVIICLSQKSATKEGYLQRGMLRLCRRWPGCTGRDLRNHPDPRRKRRALRPTRRGASPRQPP